ncbi:hypothetical protein TIFTF001_049784 [Ficus carica]|uniref:Uncharacterized protein n=1 Tax=Ficus carica TaxID=3494 RepID=A0AA87ZIE5_FICCA|nr:hypothetical protein TIFTF001_049784 [Ficus carica]
MWNGHRHGF